MSKSNSEPGAWDNSFWGLLSGGLFDYFDVLTRFNGHNTIDWNRVCFCLYLISQIEINDFDPVFFCFSGLLNSWLMLWWYDLDFTYLELCFDIKIVEFGAKFCLVDVFSRRIAEVHRLWCVSGLLEWFLSCVITLLAWLYCWSRLGWVGIKSKANRTVLSFWLLPDVDGNWEISSETGEVPGDSGEVLGEMGIWSKNPTLNVNFYVSENGV